MILLTGSTGFLGNIILNSLKGSDKISTLNRHFGDLQCDLALTIPNLPPVDMVIHSAGKAHVVPKTEIEKQEFYKVNVIGTSNLLKGLDQKINKPKYFVYISTVAVYGCESGEMINEETPLNAQDAYGKSKIQAEKLIKEWCLANHVICSVLRLPLLVGENPPGNLGAMIKAIKKGYYFNIAGGKAKKSMVLAADVAQFIPVVAKNGGVYNLTDGFHPSFSALAAVIAQRLNKKNPINIPWWLAKVMASVGDILGAKAPINSLKLNKITADLTFDDAKARNRLGWKPNAVLDRF
ncbi:NAD-dependent epimerase/dehydratase family protein [Pedobacter mucosus]|uniref:NAD-dependent epimerase/dehydratase family protein n=1 Tax=Pedobacter mucosus TaxID=2895286 RepID=UPI001EE4BB0E|nr:NAD-dependent epimerase/dehydratase family protein [Pedobacter mucosus]UKT63270.1 NAD-dependent epimerase/dehydratase family protein [Pedobacter mucosus]